MAAIWLLVHYTVKRRFTGLIAKLPHAYQSAIAVPPEDGAPPQLIALCIDLMRKTHSTVPFDELAPTERKMALQAFAIETLPSWMSKYAAFALSRSNRAIAAQLRYVKSSRPDKAAQHFGAVKRQQQLRSPTET